MKLWGVMDIGCTSLCAEIVAACLDRVAPSAAQALLKRDLLWLGLNHAPDRCSVAGEALGKGAGWSFGACGT